MSKEKKNHKIWPLKVYSNLKPLKSVGEIFLCEREGTLASPTATAATKKIYSIN